MENLKLKIKEVYLPFLFVSIVTILTYNLLRWILDVKLGILPLKEDLINFWIPLTLPWIPVMIWLRRRIRILDLQDKSDNGQFGYQFMMVAAIGAPLAISQNYIKKGSFDLIEVNNIEETVKLSKEKYFKITSFEVNKSSSLPYVKTRTLGRNNKDLNFYFYLSCPFKKTSNVWYGVKYTKTISNRISEDSKNYAYRKFIEKSESEFESYNFQNIKYFEKLSYSYDRDGYLEAIKEANSKTNEKKQIILIPKFDEFDQRLGYTFFWIFGSFGIGAISILIMIVKAKINQNELTNFKNNKPIKDDDLKNMLEFLDPRGPHQATAILLLSNIIVFIAMIFLGINIFYPTSKELLDIGGNRRIEVLNGEYWRLITSIFIHGGIIHLFMNLIGLVLGTSLLEDILGRTKLVISFIVCGIVASLASIYWHENTVSVGASGAIFGLFGLILAFTIFKIFPNYMRDLTSKLLGLYAGVSLLFGLLGGIDNAAHIGGLICGFIIGSILTIIDKEKLIKNAS